MERDYPQIAPVVAQQLKHVQMQLLQDREYLTAPECPYSDTLKALLARLGTTAKSTEGSSVTEVPLESLEAEVVSLFEELKNFGDVLNDEDVSERMAYFRVRTSLLEKLVSLKEKAAGVKQVKEFETTIIGILDDIMTPDQRTEIMQRLGSLS